MSAFDAHSLAKSRELDLAMMFVQGRLVCPSHRFGQIRILASTFRAPSAKYGRSVASPLSPVVGAGAAEKSTGSA